MCLAVPFKIEDIMGAEGVGEFDGLRRKIRLDFVPKAKAGDYVLVHAGFAIEVLDPKQAEEDREAYREVLRAL